MFIVLRQLETALRAMKNYIDNIIPKKVSDLQNDAEYITESNIPTPDWNATSIQEGYIANKPPVKNGTGNDSIIINNNQGYNIQITGEANTTTYEYSNASWLTDSLIRYIQTRNAKIGITPKADVKITAIDTNNNTITVNDTLSEDSALINETMYVWFPNIASGAFSYSGGTINISSGDNTYTTGRQNIASGESATASGINNVASGYNSSANGNNTIANHRSQNTFGEYNIPDPSNAASYSRGNYIEIVGNGDGNNVKSNARTLDWNGNEWLSGNIKIGGTSYDDANAKEIATKEYVDETIANSVLSDAIITVSGTKLSITTNA